MTSWNSVLSYVKARLSLPSTFLEKTDAELKEYLINTALSEFSTYFPDYTRTSVLTDNDNYKVRNHPNQYYFFDDEDLDILTVRECYFNLSDAAIHGAPLFGPTSMTDMKWWALNVFKSNMVSKYSDFKPTYKFIEPNIIEVLRGAEFRTPAEVFVVEYARSQPRDLSKIPIALDMTFKDLCLAHVQIWIGSLRTMYSSIDTPFGPIQINGDAMKSDGFELREKIVERMQEEMVIDVILDTD